MSGGSGRSVGATVRSSNTVLEWQRLVIPERRLLTFERVIEMHKSIYVVIFVVVLIAVIVSLDLLFFRHHFWERLMSNIGIVLVFAAFYLRFLKKP